LPGKYNGGPVPLGMDVVDIPALEWAKFRCVGPLPGALQSVNTEVFKKWLPGNPDYEMSSRLISNGIQWVTEARPTTKAASGFPVREEINV